MGGWAGWLIPIASVVLIGVPVSLYLQRVRLPREESAAGVATLAGMRWRDFIHLVLDALLRRGYERIFEPQVPGEEGEYILERNGQRYLLSSKHGAAYVLGSTAIAEFANAIRMRGAAGGLLVTPGQFAPEARPLARAQRIELLDGPTLWPELRPLLPEEQRAIVSGPLELRVRRQIMYAWVVAFLVGLALFAALHRDGAATTPPPVTSPAATRIATPAASAPPVPAAQAPSAEEDEATRQQRRSEVAAAVSSLPGIDRAIWETQSTLLVHLQDDTFDPLRAICPLLERYDDLAAARLQLQPPAGSTKSVRFVQCRAY